jgi:predicted transcriptional regulator
MAWKGFDFDIINELDKEGYIRQGSHRSKSVVITDEGMKLSRELLTKYNISDWK